jgi:glycosyltransferase involved in cell wall biosynthesis
MKKKLWIFGHYAQEPPHNTMLRYHNWGEQLVDLGYSVTIFCASVVHNTNINLIKNGEKYTVSECNGVKYVYIKTRMYKDHYIKRIMNILDFFFGLDRVIRRFEKPDLIIAAIPHPLTAIVALKYCRNKKIPCICDTADLWPQGIVEYMGISSKNPIIWVLYEIEKWIDKKSDAIIFSMEGGSQYLIDKGIDIDMEKVFYINMGLDLKKFDLNIKRFSIEENRLVDNSIFKVVYCGSIRKANNVKTICDAAKALHNHGYSDIVFLIFGNGDEMENLILYCENNKILNVKFYGRILKDRIPYLLTHSDLNILSFMHVPMNKYGGSQSKLFEYLASGRPILVNARFGYSLITTNNCGIEVNNNTTDEFMRSVLYFYNLPFEDREVMGKRARVVAEEFDQPLLVNTLEKVIQYVMKKKL